VLHARAVFKDAACLYVVLPWCRGGDLFTVVASGAVALDESGLRSLTTQLLRLLAGLHDGGWAHGDICLENIVAAGDGTLKLIDFAQMRKVHDAHNPQNEVLMPWNVQTGREQCFPPESMTPPAGALRSAKKGDVYQFGCLIHQLLTGSPPFEAHEVNVWPRSEVLETGGCRATVEKLHGLGVPRLLGDFVGRLLAPDPARRPTAPEALAHPWVLGRVAR